MKSPLGVNVRTRSTHLMVPVSRRHQVKTSISTLSEHDFLKKSPCSYPQLLIYTSTHKNSKVDGRYEVVGAWASVHSDNGFQDSYRIHHVPQPAVSIFFLCVFSHDCNQEKTKEDDCREHDDGIRCRGRFISPMWPLSHPNPSLSLHIFLSTWFYGSRKSFLSLSGRDHRTHVRE